MGLFELLYLWCFRCLVWVSLSFYLYDVLGAWCGSLWAAISMMFQVPGVGLLKLLSLWCCRCLMWVSLSCYIYDVLGAWCRSLWIAISTRHQSVQQGGGLFCRWTQPYPWSTHENMEAHILWQNEVRNKRCYFGPVLGKHISVYAEYIFRFPGSICINLLSISIKKRINKILLMLINQTLNNT